MNVLAIVAAAVLHIQPLSPASAEHTLERYLHSNPPVVVAGFRTAETKPSYRILERLGVLKYDGQSYPDCNGTFPTYDITPLGYRIAKERGWQLGGRPGYLPWDLDIPLGSYALVRGSEHVVVRSHSTAIVYFSYVLHGNANVPYLLSLGSARAWGDVGVDAGGYIVPLDKAGQIVRDKLLFQNDGKGWYVNKYPVPTIIHHCYYDMGHLVRSASPSPVASASPTASDPNVGMAQRMGLVLAYAPASSGTDYPGIASVKMKRLPNVRVADFTRGLSIDKARGRLREARRALLAFAKSYPFTTSVAAGKARARIFVINVVAPKQPDFRGETMRAFRYRGLNHAAACFDRSHLRYYDVSIRKTASRNADWWILLQNGDLILNQAERARNVAEGSILRTDGTLEPPSSSLPC